MTKIQRFTSLGLAVALLLSAFAVGRWTTSDTASADAVAATFVPASQPMTSPAVASPVETVENSKFYLSDYKTGYNDGFSNAKTGQGTGVLDSSRPGYNEGFKEGYANAHQGQTQATVQPQPVRVINTTVNRTVPVRRTITNYRTVERPVYRETRARNSKLKTALTIAAPAAVGAGIGALAGGKKGAGIGALIGGGGGALYHFWKKR